MNKKSFWRGFGIGVLFAAIILGTSCLIRTSDARVIAKAKKLGMVFAENNSTVVDKNSKKEDNSASAKPGEETDKKRQETKSSDIPAETENPKAVPTPESDDTSEKSHQKATKKPADSMDMDDEKNRMEKDIRNEAQQLEIKAGDLSSTVSARLKKMGIIDDATDFDLYLSQNGYGESISAGTYTVSPGDSYQDIANKITRR